MELGAEHSPLSHVVNYCGATGLSHSDRAGSPPAV